jgi:integrase/recombinase XerD
MAPSKTLPAVVGDPADPHGLAVAVAHFLDALERTNVSPETIRLRRRQLDHLVAWLHERGIRRPAEVTLPMLERYHRALDHHRKRDGAPLSTTSKHMALSAVRVFFRWCARQHLVLHNPAADLPLPRLAQRLPRRILSAAEAEWVLNQPNLDNPMGLRDRAILEVFYSTGIRRAELAALRVEDVDMVRGTVTVRQGKGKKDRVVPIGERALAWCRRYLQELRPTLVPEPDHGVLFVARDGGGPLTVHALTERVSRFVERAGIRQYGACHLFRHTMATLMLENGADIRFIQAILGHAHLQATEIYTHVSIRKLKEVHAATHPGALLRRRAPAIVDTAAHADNVGGVSASDRREILSALAADRADRDDDEPPR